MQVINENDVAACGPQYARPPLAEAAAEADDGIGMREIFSYYLLFLYLFVFASSRVTDCVRVCVCWCESLCLCVWLIIAAVAVAPFHILTENCIYSAILRMRVCVCVCVQLVIA